MDALRAFAAEISSVVVGGNGRIYMTAHAIISEFRLASSLGAMQGMLLAGSRGCLQGNVLQRSCMTRMHVQSFGLSRCKSDLYSILCRTRCP